MTNYRFTTDEADHVFIISDEGEMIGEFNANDIMRLVAENERQDKEIGSLKRFVYDIQNLIETHGVGE